MKIKKQIITTVPAVLTSVFLVSGIVLAVTTIGTNITTEGNTTLGDAAADTVHFNANAITFEGATVDGFETTFAITDPTADRIITFQNVTGTAYVTGGTDVAVADGGTGASDAATARTNLGLGSMSTQADNNVSISGGAIDGTPVGAANTSSGDFTNITATGTIRNSNATDIGWSVVAVANQVCNTTCTNACVFGQDTGAANFTIVACDNAAADVCVCAGAN